MPSFQSSGPSYTSTQRPVSGASESQYTLSPAHNIPSSSQADDSIEHSEITVSDSAAQCSGVTDPNIVPERSLELPFFYRVESLSDDDKFLQEMERVLLTAVAEKVLTCSTAKSRHLLGQARVSKILSSPEDTVSKDYVCSYSNPAAQHCHIVEGGMTLILSGDVEDDDALIGSVAYDAIETAFQKRALRDQNVIDVMYLGKTFSMITLFDATSSKDGDKAEGSSNNIFPTVLIATSGFLLVMAALILVLKRSNQKKKDATEFKRQMYDGQDTEMAHTIPNCEAPSDLSSMCTELCQ